MNNKEEIRELPWYVGDPKPTPQIIEKMVTRFPSYALNRPEISCYYATFYGCRDVVKAYFTQGKSSKMQQIAEEAWKLVDQFVGLFEMGKNLDLNRWNELNSKWDTVIRKFDRCVSSSEQQEKPAETEQDNTPDKENKADVNIHISGGIQAENVQIGNQASIQKQPKAEKSKGKVKPIVTIVSFLAALLTIFSYFGRLEEIKAVIYNMLSPK